MESASDQASAPSEGPSRLLLHELRESRAKGDAATSSERRA
eukprot:CAMPEP_0168480000 /NCGR_PEP_ID=MMETSP0228-20121227/63762_1 /TAXON_ID=133427 /ORGANISM="Protoceratium reticulatum, Strain CCCM 535 (=CCMP 1889)" /LENGTH=40 /DNA_ID= /DNA_START= /DNA_END= /DNA_ORIENTATION=